MKIACAVGCGCWRLLSPAHEQHALLQEVLLGSDHLQTPSQEAKPVLLCCGEGKLGAAGFLECLGGLLCTAWEHHKAQHSTRGTAVTQLPCSKLITYSDHPEHVYFKKQVSLQHG